MLSGGPRTTTDPASIVRSKALARRQECSDGRGVATGVVVEERRQHGWGGEAGPSPAEAAVQLERVAGGIDGGVVELVGSQVCADGAERAGDRRCRLAVAEGQRVGYRRGGGEHAGHPPAVECLGQPQKAAALGPGGRAVVDGTPDRG